MGIVSGPFSGRSFVLVYLLLILLHLGHLLLLVERVVHEGVVHGLVAVEGLVNHGGPVERDLEGNEKKEFLKSLPEETLDQV